MKTENIILAIIVLLGGAGAYYYFGKKNDAIDSQTKTSTDQSILNLFAPDIIKPTQPLIDGENISNLDCKSLLDKYNLINAKLLTTKAEDSSVISTLKRAKANIEVEMKTKNCSIPSPNLPTNSSIPDPILDSALIQKKPEIIEKYTASDINRIAGEIIQSESEYLAGIIDNDSRPQQNAIATNNNLIKNYIIQNRSQITNKLELFLESLISKADVDRFIRLYPKLLESAVTDRSLSLARGGRRSDNIGISGIEITNEDFLKKINYNKALIL